MTVCNPLLNRGSIYTLTAQSTAQSTAQIHYTIIVPIQSHKTDKQDNESTLAKIDDQWAQRQRMYEQSIFIVDLTILYDSIIPKLSSLAPLFFLVKADMVSIVSSPISLTCAEVCFKNHEQF